MLVNGVSNKIAFGENKAMHALDTASNVVNVYGKFNDNKDEFVRNYEKDSVAYADAVTNNLQNSKIKPLANIANSSIGKKAASLFGKFTSFCTSLTGQVTKITNGMNNQQ